MRIEAGVTPTTDLSGEALACGTSQMKEGHGNKGEHRRWTGLGPGWPGPVSEGRPC